MPTKAPPWWTAFLTDEDHALFEEVDQCRDQLHELMVRKRKAYYRAVRRGERARERERRRAVVMKRNMPPKKPPKKNGDKNGNGQR